MLMSEKLKALITPDTDLNQLRRIACDEGMRHLRLAGAYQVAAGTTTLEEAFRVTPHV